MHHSVEVGFAIALVACGSSSPSPDAKTDSPRDTIVESKTLLVGDLAEATLAGGPGDAAQIQLSTATALLAWDIHDHDNGETQVIIKEQDVSTVDYDFVPPSEASWNLLIRNQATTPIDVEVEIELYGEMQWRTWN